VAAAGTYRAQVLAVSVVLAHLGDAVRRRGERGLAARCRQQVRRQRLGAVRRLLHGQLHGQPGRVHDHTANLAAFMIAKEDYDKITGINDSTVRHDLEMYTLQQPSCTWGGA